MGLIILEKHQCGCSNSSNDKDTALETLLWIAFLNLIFLPLGFVAYLIFLLSLPIIATVLLELYKIKKESKKDNQADSSLVKCAQASEKGDPIWFCAILCALPFFLAGSGFLVNFLKNEVMHWWAWLLIGLPMYFFTACVFITGWLDIRNNLR